MFKGKNDSKKLQEEIYEQKIFQGEREREKERERARERSGKGLKTTFEIVFIENLRQNFKCSFFCNKLYTPM